MDAIWVAVLTSGAVFSFIQFLITLFFSRKDRTKDLEAKIDELGEALSYIAKAMGWINKKTKSSDEFTIDNASYVKTIAAFSFGISRNSNTMGYIVHGVAKSWT